MNLDETVQQLYARAIGELIIKYLDHLDRRELDHLAESSAVSLLRQTKAVLDDETLVDPTCFQRIDALVAAFYAAGLSTSRHLEYE